MQHPWMSASVHHFSSHKTYSPPPAAIPAILTYLALRAGEDRISQQHPAWFDFNGVGLNFDDNINLSDVGKTDAFVAYPPGIDGKAIHASSTHIFILSSDNTPQSERWECQWYRCLSFNDNVNTNPNPIADVNHEDFLPPKALKYSANPDTHLLSWNGTYRLGSIEGAWEGVFCVSDALSSRLLFASSSLSLYNFILFRSRYLRLVVSDMLARAPGT